MKPFRWTVAGVIYPETPRKTRAQTPRTREYSRDWKRALARRCLEAGVCVVCRKSAHRPGCRTCEPCGLKNRAYQMQRRAEHRAAGVCTDCRKALDQDATHCRKCARIRADKIATKRATPLEGK